MTGFIYGVIFTLLFIAYIIAFVKIAHRNELESIEVERLTKGEKEKQKMNYKLYKGTEGWAVVPDGAIGFEASNNTLTRWIYDEQEFDGVPYIDVMKSYLVRKERAEDNSNLVSTEELEKELSELNEH